HTRAHVKHHSGLKWGLTISLNIEHMLFPPSGWISDSKRISHAARHCIQTGTHDACHPHVKNFSREHTRSHSLDGLIQNGDYGLSCSTYGVIFRTDLARPHHYSRVAIDTARELYENDVPALQPAASPHAMPYCATVTALNQIGHAGVI